MKKKVNIYPRGPITAVNPPIRVPVKNVTKDIKDIRKCIMAGARVDEVTPNGIVSLNLQNYDLDNGADYDIIDKGINMYAADKTIPAQEPALVDDDKAAAVAEEANPSIAPINNPIDPVVEDNNDYGEDVEPIQEPIDTPKEEDAVAVSEAKDEAAPIISQGSADDELETMDVDELLGDDTEDKPAEEAPKQNKNLSKKQRRALKRVQNASINTESSEAPVETVDAEADAEEE